MIYAGSINRDHVHMLIGIPPQLSVSRAVQYLKGKYLTGKGPGSIDGSFFTDHSPAGEPMPQSSSSSTFKLSAPRY
ncbi:transposase [Candidatus Thiosymbion oneisti]|uniref:transposase n=1 Tax=Candidatus Thiosymbion oneisti TaxID=589554 RepID=UPI003C7D8CB4